MKKIVIAALLTSVAAVVVALPPRSAGAQLSPTPIVTLVPTFSCSATVSGTAGNAVITKTNAAALNKARDVVATIHTPTGPVSASVCGSAFTSVAVGTKTHATFTVPVTKDTSWIYTCSAVQTNTDWACSPVK